MNRIIGIHHYCDICKRGLVYIPNEDDTLSGSSVICCLCGSSMFRQYIYDKCDITRKEEYEQ